MPLIFGVLTTETVAQAIERADPAKFNRGGEAAKSAIEMASVIKQLKALTPVIADAATRPKRTARKKSS